MVRASDAFVDCGEAFFVRQDFGLVAATEGVLEVDCFPPGFFMVEAAAIEGRRDGLAVGAIASVEAFVEERMVGCTRGIGAADGNLVSLVHRDERGEILPGGDHGLANGKRKGILLREDEAVLEPTVELAVDRHRDGGVLVNRFVVPLRAGALEGLVIAEIFCAAHGGDHVSARGVQQSLDEIGLRHVGLDGADDAPGVIGMEGVLHGEASGLCFAQGVLEQFPVELRAVMILVEEQIGRHVEEVIRAEDAHADYMGFAIVEQSGEGCEIDPEWNEVDGLNPGCGQPEVRSDAAGEDPRIDGRESGGFSIHEHLDAAKAAAVAGFEGFERVVARLCQISLVHAGIPAFVVRLALGDDVKVGAFDVAGEGEPAREDVVLRIERLLRPGGIAAQRVNAVGHDWRGASGLARIEEQAGGYVDGLIGCGADPVVEDDLPCLWLLEERAVVREIALDVPVLGEIRFGLHGGAEVEIHPAEPYGGSAVELASGRDREICFEYNFAPFAGASAGRDKLKRVRACGHGGAIAVIIECFVLKEGDGTWGGGRPRYGRFGRCDDPRSHDKRTGDKARFRDGLRAR